MRDRHSDAIVSWMNSRMRAMSQGRTDAARTAISQEWWTAEPFRNPFIAADVEQLCSELNARWAKEKR